MREYNNGGEGTYSGTLQTRLASNTELGEWLQIELPEAIRLERYIIIPQGTPGGWGNCPGSAVVYGSNDGTTWKEVHRYTDVIADNGGVINYPFEVNSTETYNRFAIVVTKRGTSGGSGYGVSIQEWELYGVPEYDPDADGMDVVVKSEVNVPNTDWLEVYYDAKDLTGVPSTVLDMSGNGINGTVTNVTVSDGAFVFNGTDSRISSSITQDAGDYVHTATLWYYTNDNPATLGDYIYQLGGGSTNTSPSIQIFNNRLYISFMGNYIYTTASNYIQTKTWVQISYAYEGGSVTLSNPAVYINGTRITMTSGPSGSQAGNALSLGANPQLRVGCSSSNASVVNGKIANFRLFNRALSSDEIYQLYVYQKEYFGHGDLNMTLKAGRLGIGTSEPRAALDVRGDVHISGSLRKTRARMIHPNPTGISFGQDGWQTFVSYGEEWTAYSNNPLYSVSITGDFVDGTSRGIHYRLAVQNQRTMEVLYFPSSSGWIKYHYTNHTRLDGHGFLGIMSNLTLGDSYKVQLEVDPNSASNYQWEPTYGTITGLVWD